ncbi:MAG: TetR/AcrR family transcriptional regulator [Bacteroidales bacterium]|nr:TetR/AcrR family transcriptional regulator [Bacteroidales bacterium]
MKKDRDMTEKRILDAVGTIVERDGFEAVGVNAVAAASGVSKVLIYRYFNNVDQLLVKYIETNDFWLNADFASLPCSDVREFAKQIFRAYIDMLRKSPALRKLYRWELSTQNPAIDRLRRMREEMGMKIIDSVCQQTGHERSRVAAVASLITASVPYLSILSESCPVYNSLEINADSGWQQITETIDYIFDKILD